MALRKLRAILPPEEVALILAWRARALRILPRSRPLIANAALKNRHAGARCFILCNGPSVRMQDLRRLAGELVISVSSGYLHPDFSVFGPRYHCVPQTPHGKTDDVIRWFKDMHDKLGAAEIVLSLTEKALVDTQGLFARRAVRYVRLDGRIPFPASGIYPDLTRAIPGVQSVPIMALMLALYMGCKTIYLLGTEHDHFLTGRYEFFYDRGPTFDPAVTPDGRVLLSRYDQLNAFAKLWRQYRSLRHGAARVGTTIYNATKGGALDEFERVDFSTLELAGDKYIGPT